MKHIGKLMIALALVFGSFARVGAQDTPSVTLLTTGLLGPDGSAYYSVQMFTSEELVNVAVSSVLPPGAVFGEVTRTPAIATFNSQQGGAVTWTVPKVPADTIIGPFTFRVTFADSEPPLGVVASAQWVGGKASVEPEAGVLEPYEDIGSITFDAAGTGEVVEAGKTGVLVFVPEDAVEGEVTFTFERLPITDEVGLPVVEEDIWWCSYYRLTVEPEGTTFLQPFTIIYPTREALTPGQPVTQFTRTPDGPWQTGELITSGALPKPSQQRYLTEIVSVLGTAVVINHEEQIFAKEVEALVGVDSSLREQGLASLSGAKSGFGTLDSPVASNANIASIEFR